MHSTQLLVPLSRQSGDIPVARASLEIFYFFLSRAKEINAEIQLKLETCFSWNSQHSTQNQTRTTPMVAGAPPSSEEFQPSLPHSRLDFPANLSLVWCASPKHFRQLLCGSPLWHRPRARKLESDMRAYLSTVCRRSQDMGKTEKFLFFFKQKTILTGLIIRLTDCIIHTIIHKS